MVPRILRSRVMNTSRKADLDRMLYANEFPIPLHGRAHCLLNLMDTTILVTGHWKSGVLVRIDLEMLQETENIDQTSCPLLCRRLARLINGQETNLGLPFNLRGTKFQREVWHMTAAIPFGQTRSYGQVASLMGCNSPRAVGQALRANPLPIVIPCHRVIGRDGRLTGFSKGLEIKGLLLETEHHATKAISLRRNKHEDRGNE